MQSERLAISWIENSFTLIDFKIHTKSVKVNTDCGVYYSSDFCVGRQMASRIKMALTFLANGRVPSKLVYKKPPPTRRHVRLQVTGVLVRVLSCQVVRQVDQVQAGPESVQSSNRRVGNFNGTIPRLNIWRNIYR